MSAQKPVPKFGYHPEPESERAYRCSGCDARFEPSHIPGTVPLRVGMTCMYCSCRIYKEARAGDVVRHLGGTIYGTVMSVEDLMGETVCRVHRDRGHALQLLGAEYLVAIWSLRVVDDETT